MTKKMIEREYHLAILDFQLAITEDDQWTARKKMAQLERTAALLYGFDYVDDLRVKEKVEEMARKMEENEKK